MTEEKKKINKKALLGVGILVALIAVFVVVYLAFGAKPVAGSKNITIEVIGKEKTAVTYEVSTDAEFLRQAMEEYIRGKVPTIKIILIEDFIKTIDLILLKLLFIIDLMMVV